MEYFLGIDYPTLWYLVIGLLFSGYAILEGFDFGAVDYLIKPIPFNRFLKAVVRAEHIFSPSETIVTPIPSVPSEETNNFMFVRAEYENIKINYTDILFVEGLKDYVKIYTTDGKYVLTLMSLIKLENSLSSKGFSRIHRSYIINLEHIKSIQKNKGELFINATDLLNTMQIKKNIQSNDFKYVSTDYYETQVIRIGYNYKF